MNATSRYNLVTLKLDTSSLTVSARFSGGWSTVSRYFEARKRGGEREGGGRVSRETRERRTTFALSLCPSPGSQTLSTREGRRRGTRTRLTLFFFFLFFFSFFFLQGTVFLQPLAVQSLSPTFAGKLGALSRGRPSPNRFSALPGGSAARTGPLCHATRAFC